MHRPTQWRATISSVQRLARPASRIAGRRYASTFLGRTSARATSTLVRWGLAGAAVYYYNTSNVFAEEPGYLAHGETNREETYHTIDTIAEQRRAQAKRSQSTATKAVAAEASAPSPLDSPEGLEQEAEQQGAFNEETGEINWDCPCLGGMAHGPCGEQFKAAFSCFVFSKEEPKGIDCIENFKTMQNCFREHPDIYGAELTEEDDDIAVEDNTGPAHAVEVAKESINDTVEKTADAISADAQSITQTVRSEVDAVESSKMPKSIPPLAATTSSPSSQQTPSRVAAASPRGGDEGGDLVPKAWHDSTVDSTQSK